MNIGLGLDTGGTYTDAALIDLQSGELLYKLKSPTTREDLSIGIKGAIERINPDLLSKIGVVSLSSTLATNSVVEGKGSRVGLICIGEKYNNAVNSDYQVCVAGRHDLHGDEIEKLDIESAKQFIESIRGKVEGLAITGYLSVRNPEHELRVKELASEILDVPIVCGHELSSGLGFNERTSTAIMNSKLIPIIADLIKSVKAVMRDSGIHAPLMIVRGDGSQMGENIAVNRPVETILSGPAASLIGAMSMTGLKDAIVMDIGGTTTDIGILRKGKPYLNPEGATIGGKPTRVRAADIFTSGIGGDSRIMINNCEIILCSERVMPVSFASNKWKEVHDKIRSLRNIQTSRKTVIFDINNMVLDCEFFRTLKLPGPNNPFTDIDTELLKLLTDHPMTLNDAGKELNVHPLNFNVKKMEELGYIQRIGVTPTDILHAEKSLNIYDSEAAEICVKYLADCSAMSFDEFVTNAKGKIKTKLCTELMKVVLSYEGIKNIDLAGLNLLNKAIDHSEGRDFGCRIRINKPIIGIGAPSETYIKWVGEAFDTDVVIHQNSDVGNAVGAITSSVSESIEILIKPEMIGATECPYEIFSKAGNFKTDNLDEALKLAESVGREYVLKLIEKDGATDVTVTVDVDRSNFGYGNSTETSLLQIDMTVIAAGKPKQFE